MSQKKIALILGATGGVGGAVAEALMRHGWAVRALTRDPARLSSADRDSGITWIAGDAMKAEDVTAAARGATILFHGANPPGYRNWRGLAIPMLRHAIAAAKTSGARLIYPGSVYVYGADAWPLVSEDSPQHPATRKGAIRVEMEAMLRAEAGRGLRFLTVRAGDFFGPKAPSSWVSTLMMGDGKPLKAITTPEVMGVCHAWAYLPDLAEAIALLAGREASLPAAETVHFGGHVLKDRAMAEAVGRANGAPALPIRGFRWSLVYLGAPFVTFLREVLEMRYLWREAIVLDNRRLVALLGAEPHTPLDIAVSTSLRAQRARHGGVTAEAGRASCANDDAAAERIGAKQDGRHRPLSTGV